MFNRSYDIKDLVRDTKQRLYDEKGLVVSDERIEFCIRQQYTWLRHRLMDLSSTAILVNRLGNFYVPPKKIRDYLREHLNPRIKEDPHNTKLLKEKEHYEYLLKQVNIYNKKRKKNHG